MIDPALFQSRILIVDDEVNNIFALKSFLERIGFSNVMGLSDSSRVFDEVEQRVPDLIILDLHMPNIDGFGVLEHLRPWIKSEISLPILVLTADATSKTRRRALMAGASDIQQKPFDPAELSMRIRNLLETHLLKIRVREQNELLAQQVVERTHELEIALDQLKRAQDQMLQQERLSAFTEMAGGVVHDFNNTLMSIIGYSDLILQNPELLNDQGITLEYIGIMNTAGRDASLILRRLRDFYRPRDETDPMERVDLNKIVEEVVPLTQPKWKDQALLDGRTINVCLDLEHIPFLTSNASEFREMFTNLIFNAVDAMPGGGEITLRTRDMQSMALLEVSDSGIGMDEETRRRCLEPFFTTKGEKGTGLGLAMVFGIVKRHEGTVEIESAPGRGTTIRIQLPVTESRAQDLQGSEMLDRSLRVLVVDDEVISRDIVEKYLTADGHQVVTAGNAVDAVSRFKAEPFDLVVTDYAMPRMSGMDLAVVVRALAPEQKIILLTGFNIGTIPILQRDKVNSIVPKPVGHSELRRALQALFAQNDSVVREVREPVAA